MVFQPVRGFRFFNPEMYSKYKFIYKTLSSVTSSFGYEEIQVPALERGEVLSLKGGLSPDQMKEVFMFQDHGGRWIGLRFDITTPIAREVAENYFEYKPKMPLRWYYFSPMWRYERPQKGRYREFWQFGVELIGNNSLEGDAEILSLLALQLSNLGFSPNNCKILVSDRHLLSKIILPLVDSQEKVDEILRILDKKGKFPNESLLEEIKNISNDERLLGLASNILEMKPFSLKDEDSSLINSILSDKESRKIYERIKETLLRVEENLGQELSDYFLIDFSIVRGFDYYTGIVFEVYVYEGNKKIGSAICGGGRYDNLIELYGSKEPVPAIGFAFGVDRTIEALESLLKEKFLEMVKESIKVHLIFDLKDKDLRVKAKEIRQYLQSHSFFTTSSIEEYDSFKKLLKKELKYASENGFDFVIIVDETINKGKVLVKNLATGQQEEVDLESLIDFLLSPN